MARRAKIVINEKRKKLANKFYTQREELKKIIADPNASEDDKLGAMVKLQSLPKNSSKIRHRNRCGVTGRSRGYLRKFNLSRIAFRELSLAGMVPGVTKSSW